MEDDLRPNVRLGIDRRYGFNRWVFAGDESPPIVHVAHAHIIKCAGNAASCIVGQRRDINDLRDVLRHDACKMAVRAELVRFRCAPAEDLGIFLDEEKVAPDQLAEGWRDEYSG